MASLAAQTVAPQEGPRLISPLLKLQVHVQVLYREYAAGMYSKMPFALSLCCVEIPYNTVEAALFSVVGPRLAV